MNTQRAQTHPGVAAVLSFVFSGVGQIYNGQIKKGLIHVFVATLGLALVLSGALVFGIALYNRFLSLKVGLLSAALLFAGGIVICVIGIHSIYDAYENAGR